MMTLLIMTMVMIQVIMISNSGGNYSLSLFLKGVIDNDRVGGATTMATAVTLVRRMVVCQLYFLLRRVMAIQSENDTKENDVHVIPQSPMSAIFHKMSGYHLNLAVSLIG